MITGGVPWDHSWGLNVLSPLPAYGVARAHSGESRRRLPDPRRREQAAPKPCLDASPPHRAASWSTCIRLAFCAAFVMLDRFPKRLMLGWAAWDLPRIAYALTTTTTNTIQMNNTSTPVGVPTDSKRHTLQYFCSLNLNPCNSFTKITGTQNAPPGPPLRPCAKPIPCRVQIDVLFEIVAPATCRPPYVSPGASPDHPAPMCNPRGRRRTWAPSGLSR